MGSVLNGRYRLDAELGRGAMGVVYRGHDTLLGRDVAVKVLSAEVLSPETRARLLHEAQAAAQLSHPNLVAVFDAREVEGVPYVVMEVQCPSLHERCPAPSQSRGRYSMTTLVETKDERFLSYLDFCDHLSI